MGLAFRALSAAYSYSFPFTAYHQGAKPLFGLSLSRQPGKSELVVGGFNRARTSGSPDYYAVGYSPTSQFLDYIQIPQGAYLRPRAILNQLSHFHFPGVPTLAGQPALYDRVPMIFDSTTPTIIVRRRSPSFLEAETELLAPSGPIDLCGRILVACPKCAGHQLDLLELCT